MKSIYKKFKSRYTPAELNQYLREDNDESTPMYLNNKVEEVEEVSKDFVEFSKWLLGQKVSRNLKYLVMHCTATNQDAKVSAIINYWRNNLGWKSPGYHIIVKPDGSYSILSDLQEVVNGVRGYNHNSIHISYIGGVDSRGRGLDNRTEEQKRIMGYMARRIKDKYQLELRGHRDFPGVNKECPSFDVRTQF